MTDFSTLLQNGNAWVFVPSALLLGALHGLEPGHSKTMMAAFIIAVRGTVWQAVLLGLSATVSHTAIVWAIALAGLHFGAQFSSEAIEPYLQLVSAVLIIAVAAWMIWRTWRDQQHEHEHEHTHDHHEHRLNNREHHHHDYDHAVLHVANGGDAHERAHAADIRKRFANRHVTTGQIVIFGLTGGLIPCPASITILLLCLQLKQITLGAALVLCFSVGLAVTMVTVGVAAALSVDHASRHWPGFEHMARSAPYVSGALILLVGLYTGYVGWSGLAAHGAL